MPSPDSFFNGVTLAALAGGAWAVLTFLWNFIGENRRKRSELFLKMRDYFRTSESLGPLGNLIEVTDQTEIDKIDVDSRSELPAFFEDLAIIVNSGTVGADVAHYFFGYYVIKCWDNDAYWKDMRESKDDPYWRLLKLFVAEMRKQGTKLKADPSGVVKGLRI
jgi:hypothetical protein